jgi:carboxypeptidase C (cathepsin A)
MIFRFIIVLILFWALPPAALSSREEKKEPESQREQEQKGAEKPPQISETVHSITIDGKKYSYAAVAGEIPIEMEKNNDGAKGRIFYISYTLEGKENTARPLTFAFNGGPGAASVWLHLGGLGPKRIALSDDGEALPPPVRYKNNPYTWLAFTDLVFVDPIGTGFSRTTPEEDKKKGQAFYGVEQDIHAVAEFIRLYLNENGRWMSPKFLVGESYGTTRAAGLAWRLHERYGIDLNAVVLISPVLDFETILFHPSSDLSYALFLPAYSAAARHHGMLPEGPGQWPLSQVLAKAEAFSLEDYIILLARGDRVTDQEKDRLLERLNSFTGLSEEIIRKHRFRIDWTVFTKRLLEEKNLVLGRMDTTVTGISPDPAKPRPQYDPALDTLFGPFSSAMNAYVRDELLFETSLFYESLNLEVTRKWDWRSGLTMEQGFVDVSHTLKKVMTIREDMRVFIACGLYDLATPYFASQYTVNHMWLAGVRSNVTMKNYEAGHMIYLHQDALKNLFEDIKTFYSQEGEK